MRLSVLVELVGLTAFGCSGCGTLGSDYKPGIANHGYVPGHGRPTAQEESKMAEMPNRIDVDGIAPDGGNMP